MHGPYNFDFFSLQNGEIPTSSQTKNKGVSGHTCLYSFITPIF